MAGCEHGSSCERLKAAAQLGDLLSRSQSESLTIIEKLKFAGLRVVFVSQGIDTDSEQSDVQMTVHGLVDSLYVKELAKKTHRGLESCALRGLHTGGRCFGYSTLAVGEGPSKRLVINETEAAVVREIFEMFAAGQSLKKIAKYLNAQCVPSPRSKSSHRGTWCPSAIRAMLKRELYRGEIVWNRSKFLKVPGSNKRRSRPRPESERKRFSAPSWPLCRKTSGTGYSADSNPLMVLGRARGS